MEAAVMGHMDPMGSRGNKKVIKNVYTLTHGIMQAEDIETAMEAIVRSMSEDGSKFYCSVYDDGKEDDYENSRAAALSVWIRGFIESKGFSARRDEACYAWKWKKEDKKGEKAFILDLVPVTSDPGEGPRDGAGPDMLIGEKEARECGTAIRAAADRAKDAGEKIIIGIDTSWIPEVQQAAIQPLLNRLSSLGRIKGLENVIIRRSNDGGELARVIKEEARLTGTPLSNVIILGSDEVLGRDAFKYLKKPEDGTTGAFFAEIDLPDEPLDATEIKLTRMIEVSLRKAFKPGGSRECRFYLRADPVDLGELRKLYERERDVLVAA
ncbi:MAG: hypothetical protein HQL30_06495 [Candidatus Omnitrophica bacterium]|nr:hypothetical protein [Candidatus Omnitrophota bacterium]